MKITFFGTQPYDRESFDRANAAFGFEFNYHRSHLNANNALLAKGADAVCIFVNDTADTDTIRQLAEMDVKLIALRCAGFNNVDLKAAAEYGIPVVRVPAYSPCAVAEHAVALMLALNRKVHRAYWRTRDGNFSLHGLMGFDMYGKTAGIIGTGKIARELIRILKGFGMEILAYDIYPDEKYAAAAQIKYVPLDELYRRADIISLHCPLTDQTRYMINEGAIARMKPGVIIINTGRGQLIRTEALIEGLKEKKVGAAGLDVYEEEAAYFYEDTSDSIMNDDVLARLLSFNNVIMTSHQGFFTHEALDNIAHTTLQNINDFDKHRELVNEVRAEAEKAMG
ncbi:2-hydroxyacid dehydrogenase [Alistipes sp.]|uniref:2-hydroxyacid dehydrogenase n=1 Tax=Alistipes sp. TaxID=1872444 RepID=UPI003AB256C6